MRSARSFIVGLTAAGLLALPGIAAAAPTSSPADTASAAQALRGQRFDTKIRFLAFDHTRGFGTKTVVRGQVVSDRGAGPGAIPGIRVKLYRQLDGTSRWVFLDKDYTSHSASPSFRLHARSKANAAYKVVYAGNDNYRRSHDVTSVSVYRYFDAQLEDGTGRFHGKVTPAYAHRVIYLAKRRCADCGWDRVRSEKTRRHGLYSFKVGAPRHGRWWWRVSTPASTAYIASNSAVYTTSRG
jgi:hypothetical protein